MLSMDNFNVDAPIRDRSRSGARGDNADPTFGRLNAEPDYSYGGRGRGRSPVPRRRRSRSPQAGNIDRYVPGGSPRPRRSRSPAPHNRRYDSPYGTPQGAQRIDRYIPGGGPGAPLNDPHKLDYSVTYTYFSDWYHSEHKDKQGTIEKAEVQAAYDAYKDDLNARLAKLFVTAHKNDEWFKERYMPGEKEKTKEKIVAYRREQWLKWKKQLDEGKFDDVDRESKSTGADKENGAGSGDPAEDINRGCDDGGLKPVLLIKTISPTVSRVQLEELAQNNLPNFHYVSLSDPNPLKKFHRIGFILLKGTEDDPTATPPVDESTVELLNGKSIHDETHGDFVCHVGIHNGPTNPKTRKLLNEYMSMPVNLRKEAELVEKCIKKLEAELHDDSSMEEYDGWECIKDKVEAWGAIEREARAGSEEEGEEESESEVELKILKKKIDIGVEYLRRAFNFCMYCVSSSDSIHELTRKCPGGHIRRPTPSPDYVADQRTINWTKNWQSKLELFVNPPTDNSPDYAERLRKLGGKPVDEYVAAEIMKFVKQEDEGKFRCRVNQCTKLFKAEEFWRKHLDKKHTDWLHTIQLDARLINAYVSDPTRVHPPKVEQNAQGNFNMPGPGPRNPAAPLPMQLFPPHHHHHHHLPPGFPVPLTNGIGRGRGAGPMRREPPRRTERYGQPYTKPVDRETRERERERRDREMKEAQRARAPAGATVVSQPVEDELALMGRKVKSYNDLDASAGAGQSGGVGELDY